MGKNLREKRSWSRNNENEGGCVWGLLHIIKYHHWRHVKKRLTHKTRYIAGNPILPLHFYFILFLILKYIRI